MVGATIAAALLRAYGCLSVLFSITSLWLKFAILPGTHGIADWSRGWPVEVVFALLGAAVFFQLRWVTLLFAVASSGFGLFMLLATLSRVPFPWAWFNVSLVLLAIVPAFLTYCAWPRLR
jgi:hypothetical protein